jgi:hypothetical protein
MLNFNKSEKLLFTLIVTAILALFTYACYLTSKAKSEPLSGYIVTDKGIKRDVKIYLTVTACNKEDCVQKELTVDQFNSIKIGDVFHE